MSVQVWADLYGLPVAGCDGKTAAQVFEAAGCDAPASPSSAACLGGPKDTFARMNEPQVCVSTTNRRAAALGLRPACPANAVYLAPETALALHRRCALCIAGLSSAL